MCDSSCGCSHLNIDLFIYKFLIMGQRISIKALLGNRRLMLLAPVVVVPALVVIFYGLAGGRGLPADLKAAGIVKGLNMKLPEVKPDVKGKAPDKLDLYAKAADGGGHS